MTEEVFCIDDQSGGEPCDALPKEISERIFWGRGTIVTISDLAPGAVLSVNGRSQECWRLLLQGGGVHSGAFGDQRLNAGALVLLQANAAHAFRAGDVGARFVEFCGAASGLDYERFGELPLSAEFK